MLTNAERNAIQYGFPYSKTEMPTAIQRSVYQFLLFISLQICYLFAIQTARQVYESICEYFFFHF